MKHSPARRAGCTLVEFFRADNCNSQHVCDIAPSLNAHNHTKEAVLFWIYVQYNIVMCLQRQQATHDGNDSESNTKQSYHLLLKQSLLISSGGKSYTKTTGEMSNNHFITFYNWIAVCSVRINNENTLPPSHFLSVLLNNHCLCISYLTCLGSAAPGEIEMLRKDDYWDVVGS